MTVDCEHVYFSWQCRRTHWTSRLFAGVDARQSSFPTAPYHHDVKLEVVGPGVAPVAAAAKLIGVVAQPGVVAVVTNALAAFAALSQTTQVADRETNRETDRETDRESVCV